MLKHTIVQRSTYEGDKRYLILYSRKETTTIEAKKWAGHGNIIRNGTEGNGYHGRCENCGLALVTDLGYNSWSDTTCEIEGKSETETIYTIGWSKFYRRAKRMTEAEALKYQRDLIHEQGWGEYCFLLLEYNGVELK